MYYSGLGYLVPWEDIWTELQPGAVLQLWKSRSAYKDVRDKTNVQRLGHSVIFKQYVKKGKATLERNGNKSGEYEHEDGMLVVEQYGEDIIEQKIGRQVVRKELRWRFAVGANFYPL